MTHNYLFRACHFFLILSLVTPFVGCANDGIETKTAPAATPVTTSAAKLSPKESEMLQVAASGNNARVKALLDEGIDVNTRGADRNTPIMEAAYGKHLDTVKLLLDHGADLSAKKNDGATPASLAQSREISDLFRDVAALVEVASQGSVAITKQLIDKGTPVNGLDLNGHSALTEAAWNGKTEVIRLLLARGANPNIKKSDGQTPASLAAGQNHPDIVALLNEASAKLGSNASSSVSPQPTSKSDKK